MHVARMFLITLFLAFPLSLHAETGAAQAQSKIAAVTVFPDRAQVTRHASLTLKPGMNLVNFDDLPQLMMEESLRAEGKGTGRARIAGISVKKIFLDRTREKRVRELEDEITQLARKVESVEARRKALVAQKAFVDSIRVGYGERISKEIGTGKPTSAELDQAMHFVGDNTGKIEERIYDAEAEKRPLQDRIAALKKELEQSRADRMKEVRSVQVALEAEREMKFDMELSYLVPQATWVPTYDVRLAPDGKEAQLVYRARVWQMTGEDWLGVKLTLSTASPATGGGAPELLPWRVSFYEPPRPITYLPRAKMEMAVPMMESAPAAPAEDQSQRAEFGTAQVAQGQTSVQFQVVQPVDVTADGSHAQSVIATERLPVTVGYETVPKLSPRAYLKSSVTNRTAYPLLAGEVNIFNDAVFVGKSELKTVASGEDFDLYFGSDDQVKVKRETARVKKKGGLIADSSVTYHVDIELQNFKTGPVSIELKDQKPLPGNAEIGVRVEELTLKPAETKEDGTLVWKLELAPGEKRKVAYDIVIDYPKGRDIVGLE